MDRRTFTKAIATGATLMTTGISLNALASKLGPDNCDATAGVCADFRNLVGEPLSITGHPDNEIELVDIEAASAVHPELQFYLRFAQRGGAELPEGIYELAPVSAEPFTLLLNPSQTRSGMMEAVINQQTAA